MPSDFTHAKNIIARLLEGQSYSTLASRLEPSWDSPAARVTTGAHITPQLVERRWKRLPLPMKAHDLLLAKEDLSSMTAYQQNIENFIGITKVPLGLGGPLRVNGLFAKGDYYLPLATSEAALVASYHRGACLLSQAGGCSAMLLAEGVSRSPGFAFATAREAGLFVAWSVENLEEVRKAAEATTRHGKLSDLRITIEGNHVYLLLEYLTGDASGQNMATIATEAACTLISRTIPGAAGVFFRRGQYVRG